MRFEDLWLLMAHYKPTMKYAWDFNLTRYELYSIAHAHGLL